MGVPRSVRLVLELHYKDSHIHMSRCVAGCTSGANESHNKKGVTDLGWWLSANTVVTWMAMGPS